MEGASATALRQPGAAGEVGQPTPGPRADRAVERADTGIGRGRLVVVEQPAEGRDDVKVWARVELVGRASEHARKGPQQARGATMIFTGH